MGILFVYLAFTLSVCSSTVFEQLDSLRFKHNGVVKSTDQFVRRPGSDALYLECENCTQHSYSWSTNLYEPLAKVVEDENGSAKCDTTTSLVEGWDRPGGDYAATPQISLSDCADACCGDSECRSFVFVSRAPADYLGCTAGNSCCYQKKNVPALLKFKDEVGSLEITSGVKEIVGEVPPLGMRSAVPLGGLGAGSFELRGDGSMHEWTIANQSPGGAAKVGLFDDAMFGVKVGDSAKVLRTHPPRSAAENGISGVEEISYSGAYPVSRLSVTDSAIAAQNVKLFAHSRLSPNDLAHSAAPGVVFSLNVENPTDDAVEVEFMFNLPISIEENTRRVSEGGKVIGGVESALGCLHHCNDDDSCTSWWLKSSNCTLYANTPPLNSHDDGAFSGVKGEWTMSDDGCLTLSRGGDGPAAGDVSICGGEKLITADDFAGIFKQFTSEGESSVHDKSAYGAAVAKTTVAANSNETLSLSFSWRFPDRDYMGHVIGNHYAQLWDTSAQVGNELLETMERDIGDIAAFHSTFFDSSLPDYLTDSLVNSVSHVRSAWWREANSDQDKNTSSALDG